MRERIGAVTLGSEPLTLIGNEVKMGDRAPDFEAVAPTGTVTLAVTKVNLAAYAGKTLVISAVPSLDTPVCNLQTHRFLHEIEKLGPSVAVATVSMDLPYSQARWRREKDASAMTFFSDHMNASFGTAYGILIKELRLLTRAVFIVGPDGIIHYIQVVKELNNEPDYDDVLNALTGIAQEEAEWRKA